MRGGICTKLPDKLLPDAVAEMLAAEVRDGASKVYLKVLRFYLGQLAEVFHCQLRPVTMSQLSAFFRGHGGVGVEWVDWTQGS